jgi:hypothetical protein
MAYVISLNDGSRKERFAGSDAMGGETGVQSRLCLTLSAAIGMPGKGCAKAGDHLLPVEGQTI